MKHKLFLLGALLLLLTVTSCRQESDALYSYGQNGFQEANESYAGEFKLFWHAMNQNYALWDYEREFDLDDSRKPMRAMRANLSCSGMP